MGKFGSRKSLEKSISKAKVKTLHSGAAFHGQDSAIACMWAFH